MQSGSRIRLLPANDGMVCTVAVPCMEPHNLQLKPIARETKAGCMQIRWLRRPLAIGSGLAEAAGKCRNNLSQRLRTNGCHDSSGQIRFAVGRRGAQRRQLH
jgi:hypothetical protein